MTPWRINMKHANLLLLGIASLTLLSGCERGAGTLSVTGGDPVTYLCEQGQRVQVRYCPLRSEPELRRWRCQMARITPCHRAFPPPAPATPTIMRPSGGTREMKALV
jgi:hypothetical protein